MPNPTMNSLVSHHVVVAAADVTQESAPGIPGAVESGVANIEALPHDIAQIPVLQHLSEVIPAADLVFGGAMLLAIVIFHATGVRFVTNHVVRRSLIILQRPTAWRADLLMSGTVFTEKLLIEPGRRSMQQVGVMGPFDVFGNVIVLTPKPHADRIYEQMLARVDGDAGIAFGACRLPNDCGLVFKVLGMETQQVKNKIRAFWSVTREVVTGAKVPQEFLWR